MNPLSDPVHYRVDVPQPVAHTFRVVMTVPQPAVRQVLSLPAWIPGSYMVREFARHLSRVQATQRGAPIPLRQRDKATWEADCTGDDPLQVSYDVYAYDTSVRTAYLDDERGFFNGTSLCLRAVGHEGMPHQLQIGSLPDGWNVATAMQPDGDAAHTYRAADYAELIDHPFELGRHWQGTFEAGGVPHSFAVAGAWPQFDGERLLADTARICAAQIAFWHGDATPAFDRYTFLLNAIEDGYGGLEHRNSCALLVKRRDLPQQSADAARAPISDSHVGLLGLISHEYFHTWNVKRLKPREFLQLDYGNENYTQLLWFFEGFTSYYDDLFLVRSGLIDAPRYLKLLGRTINGVLATPGRQVQSVAEASFDAWVKYYRPDENSPNATISYYAKGSLVGLLLDLTLRSGGHGDLDTLMRALWQRCETQGLTEADIADGVAALGGSAVRDELLTWVHGRDDLPLTDALSRFGVKWGFEPTGHAATLGLRLSEGPITGVQVKSVLAGSAAAAAGVSAGDELLAIDGLRIRRLDEALQWVAAGQPFDVLLTRQQRVRTVRVVPDAAAAQAVLLSLDESAAPEAQALRRAWLGGG